MQASSLHLLDPPTEDELARRVDAEVDGAVIPTASASSHGVPACPVADGAARAVGTAPNKAYLAGVEVLRTAQGRGGYNQLDPVLAHPTTGAKLFIGSGNAAFDRTVLDKHGITAVVCCAEELEFFHADCEQFSYHRIHPLEWDDTPDTKSAAGVIRFFEPTFTFVDTALSAGRGVLVHCFAGAHRAGTVGVACVMRFSGGSLDESLAHAKRCRPAVDPFIFPELEELLTRLDAALELERSTTDSAPL